MKPVRGFRNQKGTITTLLKTIEANLQPVGSRQHGLWDFLPRKLNNPSRFEHTRHLQGTTCLYLRGLPVFIYNWLYFQSALPEVVV